MRFSVPQELERSLAVVSGTLSEDQRAQALEELATSDSPDASRLLMEMLRLTSWSPLQCQIIRALGRFADDRSLEFLYRIARTESDHSLAREAVFAIGLHRHPFAVQLLTGLALDQEGLFRREAFHALGDVPVLTSAGAIYQQRESLRNNREDPRLLNAFLLVLAKHGYSPVEKDILELLQETALDERQSTLFHSCLLAAGNLHSSSVSRCLQELDLGGRTFSSELRNMVIRNNQKLATTSHVDLLQSLDQALTIKEQSALLSRLRQVGSIPLKEAWALQGHNLEEQTGLWVEIEICDYIDKKAVAQLFERVFRAGNEHQLALLCQYALEHSTPVNWRAQLQSWDATRLARLGMSYADNDVIEILIFGLENCEYSDQEFVILCNSLVFQCYCSRDKNQHLSSMKLFSKIAADERRSAAVRGRAVRALGQLGCVLTSYSNVIKQLLKIHKQSDELRSSVYHALGHIPDADALYALIELLNQQKGSSLDERILEQVLTGICQFSPKLLGTISLEVPGQCFQSETLRKAVLRLMGLGAEILNPTHEVIGGALESDEFAEKLLGFSAHSVVLGDEHWSTLTGLCSHENETVRALALEALFRSRNGAVQDGIVQLLGASGSLGSGCSADLILHCLDVIEIDENKPPLELARFLVQVASGEVPRDAFADARVREEAAGAAELILSLSQNLMGLGADAAGAAGLTGVDASLSRDLAHFPQYGETLKTVLRNAELALHHPDVFDARVDKSTSIIEYVKSLDLFLQERVGEPLFLESRNEILTRLRTRIAALGFLDGTLPNPQILKILEADQIYAPHLFPSIKLAKMVQSIQSGRFVTEQLQILDGLKGWSVFLLVFARSYAFSGRRLEPVVPVKGDADRGDEMARLAWELILLQDKRNTAAHRGTVLDIQEVIELRELALRVLSHLDRCFPPRTRARTQSVRGVRVSA